MRDFNEEQIKLWRRMNPQSSLLEKRKVYHTIYQKWVGCRRDRAACLNGGERMEGRDVTRWYAKLDAEDRGTRAEYL